MKRVLGIYLILIGLLLNSTKALSYEEDELYFILKDRLFPALIQNETNVIGFAKELAVQEIVRRKTKIHDNEHLYDYSRYDNQLKNTYLADKYASFLEDWSQRTDLDQANKSLQKQIAAAQKNVTQFKPVTIMLLRQKMILNEVKKRPFGQRPEVPMMEFYPDNMGSTFMQDWNDKEIVRVTQRVVCDIGIYDHEKFKNCKDSFDVHKYKKIPLPFKNWMLHQIQHIYFLTTSPVLEKKRNARLIHDQLQAVIFLNEFISQWKEEWTHYQREKKQITTWKSDFVFKKSESYTPFRLPFPFSYSDIEFNASNVCNFIRKKYNTNTLRRDQKILLDPGHLGAENAQDSRDFHGFREGYSNYIMALLTKRILVECLRIPAHNVQFTRENLSHEGEVAFYSDRTKVKKSMYKDDIYHRSYLVEWFQPDVFVSIHVNAVNDNKDKVGENISKIYMPRFASDAESFFYKSADGENNTRRFANNMKSALNEILPLRKAGKQCSFLMNLDRDQASLARSDFHIFRTATPVTKGKALLIEGFAFDQSHFAKEMVAAFNGDPRVQELTTSFTSHGQKYNYHISHDCYALGLAVGVGKELGLLNMDGSK